MITTGSNSSDQRTPRQQLALTRSGVERSVVRALRALLTQLGAPPPMLDDEEVVLAVELDGVRYTLTQQQTTEVRPRIALSAREREVARLISIGHTNKTVAAVLEISLWTVDTHLRRIFTKLGVRSRSAMVARLAELGLLE
jgi:DNA-binding CsgD family transcriptional regulator